MRPDLQDNNQPQDGLILPSELINKILLYLSDAELIGVHNKGGMRGVCKTLYACTLNAILMRSSDQAFNFRLMVFQLYSYDSVARVFLLNTIRNDRDLMKSCVSLISVLIPLYKAPETNRNYMLQHSIANLSDATRVTIDGISENFIDQIIQFIYPKESPEEYDLEVSDDEYSSEEDSDEYSSEEDYIEDNSEEVDDKIYAINALQTLASNHSAGIRQKCIDCLFDFVTSGRVEKEVVWQSACYAIIPFIDDSSPDQMSKLINYLCTESDYISKRDGNSASTVWDKGIIALYEVLFCILPKSKELASDPEAIGRWLPLFLKTYRDHKTALFSSMFSNLDADIQRSLFKEVKNTSIVIYGERYGYIPGHLNDFLASLMRVCKPEALNGIALDHVLIQDVESYSDQAVHDLANYIMCLDVKSNHLEKLIAITNHTKKIDPLLRVVPSLYGEELCQTLETIFNKIPHDIENERKVSMKLIYDMPERIHEKLSSLSIHQYERLINCEIHGDILLILLSTLKDKDLIKIARAKFVKKVQDKKFIQTYNKRFEPCVVKYISVLKVETQEFIIDVFIDVLREINGRIEDFDNAICLTVYDVLHNILEYSNDAQKSSAANALVDSMSVQQNSNYIGSSLEKTYLPARAVATLVPLIPHLSSYYIDKAIDIFRRIISRFETERNTFGVDVFTHALGLFFNRLNVNEQANVMRSFTYPDASMSYNDFHYEVLKEVYKSLSPQQRKSIFEEMLNIRFDYFIDVYYPGRAFLAMLLNDENDSKEDKISDLAKLFKKCLLEDFLHVGSIFIDMISTLKEKKLFYFINECLAYEDTGDMSSRENVIYIFILVEALPYLKGELLFDVVRRLIPYCDYTFKIHGYIEELEGFDDPAVRKVLQDVAGLIQNTTFVTDYFKDLNSDDKETRRAAHNWLILLAQKTSNKTIMDSLIESMESIAISDTSSVEAILAKFKITEALCLKNQFPSEINSCSVFNNFKKPKLKELEDLEYPEPKRLKFSSSSDDES